MRIPKSHRRFLPLIALSLVSVTAPVLAQPGGKQTAATAIRRFDQRMLARATVESQTIQLLHHSLDEVRALPASSRRDAALSVLAEGLASLGDTSDALALVPSPDKKNDLLLLGLEHDAWTSNPAAAVQIIPQLPVNRRVPALIVTAREFIREGKRPEALELARQAETLYRRDVKSRRNPAFGSGPDLAFLFSQLGERQTAHRLFLSSLKSPASDGLSPSAFDFDHTPQVLSLMAGAGFLQEAMDRVPRGDDAAFLAVWPVLAATGDISREIAFLRRCASPQGLVYGYVGLASQYWNRKSPAKVWEYLGKAKRLVETGRVPEANSNRVFLALTYSGYGDLNAALQLLTPLLDRPDITAMATSTLAVARNSSQQLPSWHARFVKAVRAVPGTNGGRLTAMMQALTVAGWYLSHNRKDLAAETLDAATVVWNVADDTWRVQFFPYLADHWRRAGKPEWGQAALGKMLAVRKSYDHQLSSVLIGTPFEDQAVQIVRQSMDQLTPGNISDFTFGLAQHHFSAPPSWMQEEQDPVNRALLLGGWAKGLRPEPSH
jgi:hypothetical protein